MGVAPVRDERPGNGPAVETAPRRTCLHRPLFKFLAVLLFLSFLLPTQAAPVGAAPPPRLRVAAAGPWLETAGGARVFVYGVNYQGPPDQAWQMWQPTKFDRARIAQDFGRMRAGGYTAARIFVQAPLNADLAANRFDKLDYVLDQADAAGLRLVLTLADYGESRAEALAARAGQLAKRYAGRGTILAWDLKNEPQFGTFGAAVYPQGQPVPLLDRGLVGRMGERLTPEQARAWRATEDGKALTPTRFGDGDAHVWANAVAYYREYLDAAADWAGDASGRSSGDFATASEGAKWRPFLAALSDTMLIWLAPQVEAIRAADPAALVTVGYNNVILSTQPANARLQVQSFHRFPTPGGGQWRALFAALDSVQRAFPATPVLLEEFGYSNGTRAGGRVDEDQTAAHETAVWLELARRGLAGGLKWMLYDFEQGANPYENGFGALRGDGSPKPAYQAGQALTAAGAWGVKSVDITSGGADLAFVARGPGLLVTAGPQRLPEMSIGVEAGGLVVAIRPAGGSRLTLTATGRADLLIDTRALLGVAPERARPESPSGRAPASRIEGGRLVLSLAPGAPVGLRGLADRPTGRAAPVAGPAGQVRFFPETGHNLIFGFKGYWERNGGLAIYGYPITEEFREVNPADGEEYTVQYFQRARFEYHPEHKGTPYEVELGLLGRQLTAGREDEAPFQRLSGLTDTPQRRFFAATGHTLAGGFRLYWERNGGLAQFGYPTSEEFTEVNPADGKSYTVQYFERARFEYHPEHKGTPYEVELGLLGWQIVQSGE
jgi:hypothetical protein